MTIRVGAMAAVAGAILGLGLGATAQAGQAPPKRPTVNAIYQVPLYKSTIVPMDRAPTRVSIGNPGVADILVIKNRELYIVGKALGSTNVVIWDDSGRNTNFDIEVTHDLDSLRSKLYELMPNEEFSVSSAQDQLILSGQVSSPAHVAAAMQIASSFLPTCIQANSDAPVKLAPGVSRGGASGGECKKGTVLNMMQVAGSQQVMLKVTVAELAHSVARQLESHLAFLKSNANVNNGSLTAGGGFDAVADLYDQTKQVVSGTGPFLSYLHGNTFAQAVLEISKTNGLAKILAEPTLTTTTGQEASFLSGGEFPVPVPQGGLSGGITVQFKEFGVKLKFTPTVLDPSRISLALNVAVSEISSDNVVTVGSTSSTSQFAIPSLSTRSTDSTVELGDGQTMGIAGLIKDNVRESVTKFPVLGDIPILGALFRSENFRSDKSELVIFVTPHLAQPIRREHYRLPTDTFVDPNDLEFYLLGSLGRDRDRPKQSDTEWTAQPASNQAPPSGSYGHDLGSPQPTTPKEKTP